MYNRYMKLRLYTWLEFAIWFLIISIAIWGFKYHAYNKMRELQTYQIFMPDVDGMIVGSPVKYMGVQIGYIQNIKLLYDTAYVKFVITDQNINLPKGVIATVEFSGLGGSKSLELYPPEENEQSKNLIVVKSPTKLHDSISLLNHMFGKIDSITLKLAHFGKEIGVIKGNTLNISPEDIGENLRQADDFADYLIQTRRNFIQKLKGGNNE